MTGVSPQSLVSQSAPHNRPLKLIATYRLRYGGKPPIDQWIVILWVFPGPLDCKGWNLTVIAVVSFVKATCFNYCHQVLATFGQSICQSQTSISPSNDHLQPILVSSTYTIFFLDRLKTYIIVCSRNTRNAV